MLILPKPASIGAEEWEKAELEAMKEVVGLYGKTWHFWQVDRDDQYPLSELLASSLLLLNSFHISLFRHLIPFTEK